MEFTNNLRALYFSAIVLAAVFAAMATQAVMQLMAQGFSDSARARVAPATACNTSADGAYFTGCSSIL